MMATERTSIRPLPEGKLYHVFLSYRDIEDDKEWVQQLISKLQKSYKFICCDHAVDFQAGRKIVENIKFAISNSMKTIVILTKEYNNSYWCEYEIEYALLMNMDMKERILIPVLKEDCEIPDYLRPFTYIDAKGDMDTWIQKLVSAIESEGQQYNDLPLTRISRYNPEDTNLTVLHEEPARLTCCGPVFHSRYVPNTLHNQPLNVSSELFCQILNRIATTQIVKGRHCRNIWLPSIIVWSCFLTLLTIVWVSSFYVGITSGSYVGNIRTVEFGIIWLTIFVVLLASLLLSCLLTRYKGKKQNREILLDVNQKLLEHNVMVTIKETKWKADLTITFLYFDVKPCLEYIKMAFNRDNTVQNSHNEYSLVNDNTTSLLIDASLPYLQEVFTGKLPSLGIYRHSKKVICLCQYMECKGYIKDMCSLI